MTMDLVLKLPCMGCGSSSDLYESGCKHLTLCLSCGRSMAQQKAKCSECGDVLTRLIREYDVVSANNDDKKYFIGRFSTGLPNFSKNKSLCKNKDKPWVLEDETGRSEYQGHLQESFSAYYLLMQEGEEISAVPAGSSFNFHKVTQYNKQLTLEEAEAKMINKKKTQDLCQRKLMKAATNGAVTFGKVNKCGGKDSKQKTCFDDDDDEGNISDNDDEEQEGARKNRPGLKRRGGDDEGNISDNGDEEEDVARKNRLGLERRGGDDESTSGDDDFDKYDSEKDDVWMLEEIFRDDDENPSIKEEPASASPISEEEIRAVLEKEQAISLQDLDDQYPGRVETNEELKAKIARLRNMSYKILYAQTKRRWNWLKSCIESEIH